MVQSKTVIFNQQPDGYPVPGETLTVRTDEVDTSTAPEGGLVAKVLQVSVDPYMRGLMREANVKRYSPAFEIGKPIYGLGLSKVLVSNHATIKVDDIIYGRTVHSEYLHFSAEEAKTLKVIQNPHNLPLQRFLGALGMPGLTAYGSLYDIGEMGKAKGEKETIFVSAAAGAVGALVGQLAKREGLRVVGSAGSDEKVKYLVEKLGFDAAFNYKTENVKEALPKYIPEGLDIYYDNVGGETLEAAIDNAKTHARIIVCGMISQYNLKQGEKPFALPNIITVLWKQIKLQGFLVGQYYEKYGAEHQKNVSDWLNDGSIHYEEDVTVGIENEAAGLVNMLKGGNFGKAVIKYADA